MGKEDTESPESSLMTDSRLRLVYVAGIGFNLFALFGAAMAGEWLFSVTFGVIIFYLSVRYWMVATS